MACAINLGSSVTITGGGDTLTKVSQYNEAGWEKDLPNLQTGRYRHGCAYFNNDAGSKVCSSARLSSTELMVGTASAWVFTGELPSPRWGLCGVNIENKVLMTGNNNYNNNQNILLKYQTNIFNLMKSLV